MAKQVWMIAMKSGTDFYVLLENNDHIYQHEISNVCVNNHRPNHTAISAGSA